ncbi:MarR family winged helix-turn-helix transcriptional regulator [Amycolatopsis sp. GM8]|uniref:MarR family winged helix-turn-helix transcriptional regulator n=1 Tax=Amycolatopsis sp. GM8 TaxID=2896530 RepID=UPI001F441D5F|nr:MarR family transcriptional regulator [Amycolatopsis sp. GM8]
MPNAPRELVESPLHLLRRALQAYTAQWQRVCPMITPPQYAVLLVVQGQRSITQTHVGELTGIDAATLTPLLRSLEERGFLTRRVDEENRRRKLLELTKEGAALVTRVKRLADQTEKRMLAGLSQEQRDGLMTALATLADLREG